MARPPADLAAVIDDAVRAARRTGPYRPPTRSEVEAARRAADRLAAPSDPDRVAAAFGELGLAARTVPDPGTGRHHLVLASDPGTERAWALIAVEVSRRPTVLVEVPHPNADLGTERVGLALLRRLRGALYLQAGTHRRAGAPPCARGRSDFPADVAAAPGTVFHGVAERLVERLRVPQLQVHGFADRAERPFDVVLSAGAAGRHVLVDAVAAGLRCTRERVVVWDDAPGPADPGGAARELAGRANLQGLAAARWDAPFVHLELSRGLREDDDRVRALADAVAAAVTTPRGRADPDPA